MRMRYGFVIPGGDVDVLVEVAQEIEAAGWDGVFIADGVYGADPWVSMAAMAVKTERVLIGPLLTPPSRRRPWTLASQVATLDRLTGGRAVLPVGLGANDTGFDKVGEATDRKVKAQLLDESLEIMVRFWSGERFRYAGEHYRVDWDSDWLYTPVQRPRVPIWVVGAWPRERSMRRALRWDGVVPQKMGAGPFPDPLTPDDVRAVAAYVREHRESDAPFEIVVEGVSANGDRERAAAEVGPFTEAGATWWIESMWDVPGGMETVRARVAQGPPRVE